MADLSKQFDVVRVPRKPERGQAFTPYNYVAMQGGDYAGSIEYNPPRVNPSMLSNEKEQVQVTGRGPVTVARNFTLRGPTVNTVAVAREHRGTGLADHLANHALSQAYTDAPGWRGDLSVVGTYLSPMSVPWRRKLTGETGFEEADYPSWAVFDEDLNDPYSVMEPNHDAMESFVDDRKRESLADIYDKGLGEPAPEPKGTVEDRKREFREQ